MGERSPFQDMLELLSGAGFDAPIVTTHEDFRYLAEDQARDVGVRDARFLLEPKSHGTGASVLTAALTIEDDPDAVILVAPILHFEGDPDAFKPAMRDAEARVRKGAIVRFHDGVSETRVSSARILEEMVAEPVAANLDVVTSAGEPTGKVGRPIGMTLIRRKDLLALFETQAPKLLKSCRKAVELASSGSGCLKFQWDETDKIPNASFEEDFVSCMKGTLSMQMLGVGPAGIVAVSMRDAVLIANRDHIAKIPGALEKLEARKTCQAREYPRNHRRWGWYESLIARDRFQVKRNMVKPGKVPMYLIEVQTGNYLGEDDTERYEDVYARC